MSKTSLAEDPDALAERQIWADMFEDADDPIAAVDTELRVIAMNRTYRDQVRRLFGVEVNRGDNLSDALAHMPQVRDLAVYLWRRAISGEVVDIPQSGEADPDGSYFDIKFRPLRDREGAIVGAFQYSRDVTERVKAEQRLRETETILFRAQKMEALGQLTGGVAHDFNNLLQVIAGNLELLRPLVQTDAKAQTFVANALTGVSRGAKLAGQLLAFGRRQPLEPKVVNLGRFIRGMDDLLRRSLGAAVELETIVSGGLWNTAVDTAQLENGLINLAINARDAMDGHGKLTIEVGNAYLDDAYVRAHPDVAPGQYVVLAVSDTGGGIAREHLDRVFEPFFTTKAEGKGSGLGLSMVYGFVKQSAGHIKIYSEPGDGTTVRIYLPRVFDEETDQGRTAADAVRGGGEAVLVVEDDDAVRETAVAMLTDLGYSVLDAPDAAAAWAILERGAPVDLLFTDVIMPGTMRAIDLVERAKARWPDLPVLYTSGYTENAIVHGGRLDPGVELLSKPYNREALAHRVRLLLDRK
jgi:PAS domain S-box-containing protein